MPRETAHVKAGRLLATGAVVLLEVSPRRIVADVRGDHDRYRTSWTPIVGWQCTCPEMRGACSHLTAVRRVTVTQEPTHDHAA